MVEGNSAKRKCMPLLHACLVPVVVPGSDMLFISTHHTRMHTTKHTHTRNSKLCIPP
jgi:hypothetical protein